MLRKVEGISQEILKKIDIGTSLKIKRGIEIAEYLKTNPEPVRELPDVNPIIFVLKLDRAIVKKRIYERLMFRLQNGMIEEVEGLMKSGISAESLKYYGLEYRWSTVYLVGEVDKAHMTDRLYIGICQFSKLKMT